MESRRTLPPIQEVIFYANHRNTPFSSKLPPLKLQKTIDKKACHHKTNRIFCTICDGRAICKHGRNRYICKDCGGSAICQHNRRKYLCGECKFQKKEHTENKGEGNNKESEKPTITISLLQTIMQNCRTAGYYHHPQSLIAS